MTKRFFISFLLLLLIFTILLPEFSSAQNRRERGPEYNEITKARRISDPLEKLDKDKIIKNVKIYAEIGKQKAFDSYLSSAGLNYRGADKKAETVYKQLHGNAENKYNDYSI